MKVETVKINDNSRLGFAVINKVDFNPSIHQLFEPSLENEKRSIREDSFPIPELIPTMEKTLIDVTDGTSEDVDPKLLDMFTVSEDSEEQQELDAELGSNLEAPDQQIEISDFENADTFDPIEDTQEQVEPPTAQKRKRGRPRSSRGSS